MIVILVVAGLKQWLSLPHIEVLISNEALLQSLDPGAELPSEQSSSSGRYHQPLPSEAREECNQKWDMSSKSIRVMMHLSLLFALDFFAGDFSLVSIVFPNGNIVGQSCQSLHTSL